MYRSYNQNILPGLVREMVVILITSLLLIKISLIETSVVKPVVSFHWGVLNISKIQRDKKNKFDKPTTNLQIRKIDLLNDKCRL